MWKSTSLVLSGFVAGWLLHGLLQPPQSREISKPGPVEDAAVDPNPAEFNPVVNDQVDVEGEQAESLVTLNRFVDTELANRNFSNAIDLCLQSRKEYFNQCRKTILGYASLNYLPAHEIFNLLELWLLEKPDDIDAGIMFVEFAIAEEKYVEAARRLALLKSYQSEPRELERQEHRDRSVRSKADLVFERG